MLIPDASPIFLYLLLAWPFLAVFAVGSGFGAFAVWLLMRDRSRSWHIGDAIMTVAVWSILIAILIVLGSAALICAIVDSLITIIFKRNPERLCWL
jgi:hypothetical protein